MWWTIGIIIYLTIATIMFYRIITSEELGKEAEKDYEELQREEGLPGMEWLAAWIVKTAYILATAIACLFWIISIPASWFIKDKDHE